MWKIESAEWDSAKLAELLKEGWEPFSVVVHDNGATVQTWVYLKSAEFIL